MIADRPHVADDSDDIILDELSTIELLRERAEVMANIPMIDAQLRDKDRRPLTVEDDSPEWNEYRDWRRRARWSLAHHKRELVEIKAILAERQDVNRVKQLARQATLPPESLPANDRLDLERRQAFAAALESETAEGLLIHAYRVIRQVLAEHVNELPDSLDEEGRKSLALVGVYLRKRYGTGRIKRFVQGEEQPA